MGITRKIIEGCVKALVAGVLLGSVVLGVALALLAADALINLFL